MKVADVLRDVGRLFLDTAPLISLVERHPVFAPLVDPIFDRLDRGELAATTSPITLLECLVLPYRSGSATLRRDFMDMILEGPGVTFCPVDAWIAQEAAELRARYNLSLADALQVAMALNMECDAILTNDLGFQRVSELRMILVGSLEA